MNIEKFPAIPKVAVAAEKARADESHAECEHCHPERNVSGELVIEVRDVHVRLQNNPVLRGVNMKIPRGEAVALIGPNGSGKTTLLRAILGLQKVDRGEVLFFGEKRRDLSRVGYVPQKLVVERSFILSVREFLALRLKQTRHWFWHRHATTDAQICRTFEEIGITSLLDRPIAALSGGQLQRVLIAFSLLTNPEVLLLDEPTAGVDTPGEQSFYELIGQIQKTHGLTVVLVSHDLSMVYRYASWIYALNGVICCEGTPEEIMNAESLRQAYGIHVSPYGHHHAHHGHVH
ncbi:MAG TPA: metal ABC transporter ATP-binding protein [Verrucomicrobiae bacterium]